ncbi:glycosyl hydrolase family 8 [Sorangium sp. So ce367]|uniref:glycosyl hydrolase family 8 n=1 Tax=Sorangium sp. So ce367 TaxID=3133305 RepID=UPI003F60C503
MNAKIAAAWDHLFKGDPAEEAVYFEQEENANGPLAQIRDIASADVRSEGMSYGMMIAVQTDHQAEFNALWNWAKTTMFHADETHPAYGYFSWQMNFDGTPLDEMPAPDGEEYFATALYFASGRWGNGEGIYNYRAEADRLLDLMKNRPDITGESFGNGETRTTTGSTLFNTENHQIRFTPDAGNFETNGDHTDPGAERRPLLGARRHERGRQPGGQRPAIRRFRPGALGPRSPERAVRLLRRHAVFHGAAARERRVQGVRAAVRRGGAQIRVIRAPSSDAMSPWRTNLRPAIVRRPHDPRRSSAHHPAVLAAGSDLAGPWLEEHHEPRARAGCARRRREHAGWGAP